MIFAIIILFIILELIWICYQNAYYNGEEFLKIKKSIKKHTQKCNDLNQHIENLKNAYIDIKKTDYGKAEYIDKSSYNYMRPEFKRLREIHNVYNCSLSVCNSARQQPFKYFCKYFNIKTDEKTLENFERVLNDFSAAEQGKNLLKNERDSILMSISGKIPFLIRKFSGEKLIKNLGFDYIDFSQLYFPKYIFSYVSAGGNSSISCNIIFNIDTLDKFVNYLSGLVKFRNSVIGQRSLMTSSLREKIKKRDNYTCKKCGASVKKEPNLLLEIDHIIPLSKNGITSEENLQTLCWKCNRSKGSKITKEIEEKYNVIIKGGNL